MTVETSEKNLGIFHGVEALDFFFVAFEGETDTLVLVVVEVGIIVGGGNFFEPRGDFSDFLIEHKFIAQSEPVSCGDIFADGAGVSFFLSRLAEDFRNFQNDVEGIFAGGDSVVEGGAEAFVGAEFRIFISHNQNPPKTKKAATAGGSDKINGDGGGRTRVRK